MKSNFITFVALAVTLVISAFSIRPLVVRYIIFQGGTQKDLNNWTVVTTQPEHQFTNPFDVRLNWMKVEAGTDGIISVAEFEAAFELYDMVSDLNDLLSDEFADITGEFDLFNKQ